jgi:multicomponent Na+:H+ antiporter subunit B
MSRIRDNYENSLWNRLTRWVNGETDPFQGKMEMKHLREEELKGESVYDPDRLDQAKVESYLDDLDSNKEMKAFRRLYAVGSVALCLLLIAVLLLTVSYLPVLGDPNGPNNNEVSARYIEHGMEESGAVNIVTNMILSYRGFDTFGETCVLFIAATCVIVLLRREEKEIENARETDWKYEPKPDAILQKVTLVLVPVIFLFGFYIILNGHLSPGGGFSGGATIGAGLILYVTTFGFHKTQRFFNEKIYDRVKVGALSLYSITMIYYFYTGANMIKNVIPLGTAGNILSSGMILPINIFVGLEVACTMYCFFALFRRGGM